MPSAAARVARTSRLLVSLTLVAGYADAVAFFAFGVFTANMTGNTVLLGGALAGYLLGPLPGDIGLLLPGISVAAFAGGASVAALLLRTDARSRIRTVALLIAMTVLLAAAALEHHAHGAQAALVAILSVVMGLQSVVAVHAGVGGVSTTYVTGTMVSAILNLLGSGDAAAVRAEGRVNAGTWALYLTGAFAGTMALRLLGPNALWIPALVVAILAAMV